MMHYTTAQARRRRGGCVAGQPTAPEMSVKMRKLTAAASVSLGTVAPPAPWAGPSGNGQSRDNGGLPAAGLAARQPVARPRHDLPCTDDPELFFAAVLTYQPGTRYWAFQGIESGIFLVLVAVLVALTIRLIIRRDA